MVGPLTRRGYSLIETIIASFLLVFTFFMVSRLFQTGLQYSTKVEGRITAVQIAEKRMVSIRRWAREAKTWTGYPATTEDSQFPGYTIDVDIAGDGNEIYSPSSRLESGYPQEERRSMDSVARRFLVTVKKRGLPDYVLVGVVLRGEPAWGGDAEIRVTPTTATLTGKDQEAEFRARAYDAEGDEIKDIFFHWEVEPANSSDASTAEIRNKTRDGRRVLVRNRVHRRSGVWVAQDGYCRLVAYIRYNGLSYRASSSPLHLVAGP